MPRKKKEEPIQTVVVKIQQFVYLLGNEKDGRYKIGKTNDIDRRLVALQTGSDEILTPLALLQVRDMHHAEYVIHDIFARWRYRREWFHITEEAGLRLLDKVFFDKGLEGRDLDHLKRLGLR